MTSSEKLSARNSERDLASFEVLGRDVDRDLIRWPCHVGRGLPSLT